MQSEIKRLLPARGQQPPLIWAFIPFRADGYFGELYDWRNTQKELDTAFRQLQLPWRWQPVTVDSAPELVRAVEADRYGHFPIVLNYCDGIDDDGFPGLSVVRLLEAAGLPFTGADASFYAVSSSKIRMKQIFEQSGVPTAPFAVLGPDAFSCAGVCARLQAPLIVKPSTSAGSWGLNTGAVVDNDAALQERCSFLRRQMGQPNCPETEIFAERFIAGREYTVFLTGSHDFPEYRHVYPALERVLNPALPERERFLSYDRYWLTNGEESPLPPGQHLVSNRMAPPEHSEWLKELAWKAHCSVGGTGYSRVDIRVDHETGAPFVLEVNANCSLSSADDDTSVGRILEASDIPFSVVIGELIADALRRYNRGQQQPNAL